MRIGHGYDVHAFGGEGPVILGGTSIDCDQGLLAYSDGDVLIHAVCDALLGAAALGDIGRHFPDSDERFRNIDSRKLLQLVVQLIKSKGYRVGNIDATVVAQKPRLAPHIDTMCRNLADDLHVVVADVNVKATTTEKLGFAGREEGIAAHAVVLLENA
jgi:2-C-methyl-D-erythritol 2,4-cyclodiphosphate synthase